MFEFFINVSSIAVPIFVLSTMLNVGLTQKLSDILEYLKRWHFFARMLIANFILAPLLMIVILYSAPFDPPVKAGLLLFSLCAGAPFLIKLTQTSQHDIALGATTMMLLMVITIAYVPVVLPLLLSGISVDAWAIARSLLLQMLFPIAAGMLAMQFLPDLSKAVQPWIAKLGNIALYAMLATTLIGYFPNMMDVLGTGAIATGLGFIAAAFGIGYIMGGEHDQLQDIGGLGTAQRNTAACMIIATQNFNDPDVVLIITVASTLGIVMLLLIATAISRDNKVSTELV
ncbi:MAG: bile acid:sodium symporter [Caldilineaceae bacterium]|nr:bile acid:sodium symporter [Caldilineaceae bacterium]